MITRLILLALLFFAEVAHADPTFTIRHAEHFGGSALLAAGATYYTESKWKGAAISFGIGFAKEEYDQWQYRKSVAGHRKPQDAFTCKSLGADALGALAGAQLGGVLLEHQRGGMRVTWSTDF